MMNNQHASKRKNRDKHVCWAEIDLDAIANNVKNLKEHVGEGVDIMIAVKANAYGHGDVMTSETVLDSGADRLAVHRVHSGIELRRAGIEAPILIMGYSPNPTAENIVENELTPTVTTEEGAAALNEEANKQGKTQPVHVKVDTGLGRFGLLPGEVKEFISYLSRLDNLELEGLYTHFASADEKDKSYTYYQFWRYQQIVDELKKAGYSIPIRHVANSAATLDLPETHLDMVRCGILNYGLYPSENVKRSVDLEPALTIKSRLVRIRELPAGSSISYGRTYITDSPTTAGLVPFGYGDGYPRLVSNRGQVLVHEKRVPILGRICMDQFVVDLDEVSNPDLGDEVVVLGEQGEKQITAAELGKWADTINYEIISRVTSRVPRFFRKDGQWV